MNHLTVMADLSRLAAGGLISAVWQGALLAAVAGLGLRLLPKTPAAVRFAIWFAVFLLLTGFTFVSLWPHAMSSTQAGGHAAWLTLDTKWSLAIAAVWMVASLARAGTLIVAAVRVRTLWKRARPVELEGTNPTLRKVAEDGAPGLLVATRWGQICTSDEVDRPTVIGFFSPKILIPDWLLEKLTATELEQIVLHEAGHLGRADDWMNLLQKIALVVFPLNPALAWVERRLCFERELACDERVLRTTQAPKAYAACLAALAEHRLGRRGFALALGALGRESELGRRVGRILRRGETMRPVHAKLVLGGAMLGLLGGAVGLERCPQVVGFAPASDQNAMVVAPAQVVKIRGLGYEAAISRGGGSALVSNKLAIGTNVSHEVLLRASVSGGAGETGPQRRKQQVESGVYSGAEAVPFIKTDVVERQNLMAGETDLAESRRASRVERTRANLVETRYSDAAPLYRRRGQAADGAVEWLVVTSWQGADGSRMVFTMTSGPNVGEKVTKQPVVVNDSERSAYEVYPYAAVPVRGGWLVIQL